MISLTKIRYGLEQVWRAAINEKAAVALWRTPADTEVHLLADFSTSLLKGRLNLQKTEPGFAVCPFLSPEGNESLTLRPGLHLIYRGGQLYQEKSIQLPRDFEAALGTGLKQPIPYHLNLRPDTDISGQKQHFIAMVDKGLKAIELGEFDKVVTARTFDSPLPPDFNVVDQFNKLEKAHPHAFVSLISIPERGTWMGASPELLVETLGHERFRTVSLAGTKPFPAQGDLKNAVWNQKEIEEQALVSRFIIEQFKTIRLREFEESGPRSSRAGTMIHLKTEYTVNMEETNFPELGTVMLQLLHPTSAVCGMPKFNALRFILAHEDLKREFYTGFLGPLNINGKTNLYVNLRCMQILRKRVVLYAGAGITHDSNPEDEWAETDLKCQTLLAAMNGKNDSAA
ncbi:MAG: chorismate-binding protein [Candidatus Neomarinimicrobiota bacterium]